MKQIIQNYRTGKLELAEVPSPFCSSKQLLVKNIASLISIGTERSILDLGRKEKKFGGRCSVFPYLTTERER
jgi:polar amino acid transport system substrate-binding protein